MKLSKLIREDVLKRLNEQEKGKWYHGTPDAREVEKQGGFSDKTTSVTYIEDYEGFERLSKEILNAKHLGDDTEYHNLLAKVKDYKKEYNYVSPVFLSNNWSVAKTYADPRRAYDYQRAEEKVFEVEVNCNKVAKIIALGANFRFISVATVREGFIDSGVSEQKIDSLIKMFNWSVQDNKGIQTDVIAAIGSYLGFDCIDVVGVLDSYNVGNTQSTVRMVLNPSKIKIK